MTPERRALVRPSRRPRLLEISRDRPGLGARSPACARRSGCRAPSRAGNTPEISARSRLDLGSTSALSRLSPSAPPRLYLGSTSAPPRLYLGSTSAPPRLYFGSISALPRLDLGSISAVSREQAERALWPVASGAPARAAGQRRGGRRRRHGRAARRRSGISPRISPISRCAMVGWPFAPRSGIPPRVSPISRGAMGGMALLPLEAEYALVWPRSSSRRHGGRMCLAL